jgi:hypothetical protein
LVEPAIFGGSCDVPPDDQRGPHDNDEEHVQGDGRPRRLHPCSIARRRQNHYEIAGCPTNLRYMSASQDRFPCPCCGYLTLDEPANGSYEICPVCFWEDDPIQNVDPTFSGGANIPSLEEARRNFLAFGAVEERLKQFVRAPEPSEMPAS